MTNKLDQKWDVQHHFLPDFYAELLAKRGTTDVAGMSLPKWSPEKSLAAMDKMGIERAFLSLALPGVHLGDDGEARDIARETNNFLIDVCKTHSDRFSGFASLPLPDVEGAIAEYDRVVASGDLNGVILMSSVNGHYPGNDRYRPLFERMDRDRAVVFVHPAPTDDIKPYGMTGPMYLWFLETTKALASLLAAGFHRDYPNIRFIFAHGGGAVAAMAEDLRSTEPNLAQELADWRSQLYFDTAKFSSPEAILGLLGFTSIEHLLFSSDIPWVSRSKVRYWVTELSKSLPKTDVASVWRHNTQNLFDTRVPSAASFPSLTTKPRTEVHRHGMPKALSTAIAALNIDVAEVRWFDATQLADGTPRIVMDLPDLWGRTEVEISTFLERYNSEISALAQQHNGRFEAFGSVDLNNETAALAQVKKCQEDPHISGLCLFPPTDQSGPISHTILDALKYARMPLLIHPRDARGPIVFNEAKLAAPLLLTQLMHTGAIDKLLGLPFVLTHTCGVHRHLAETAGVLFYLRKKRWHMLKLLVDFLIVRRMKGEALLVEAEWD
ncbi:amidohydrolase family protein [uncultured Shimia sp.]|uniref:amidohydrolase family protein n=1 Tax=uncultured Shimia sp. TaxID=573152 RepID=UPI0025F7C025|nr:amidohydrolase family protein [uncultured Shimia sp.]